MNTSGTDNRRQFRRIEKGGLVRIDRYPLPADHKGELVSGIVRNLSAGGALFQASEPYRVGEFLALEMDLKSWDIFKKDFGNDTIGESTGTLNLLAKVVHIAMTEPDTNYDVGVCFVAVDDGRQWELVRLIDQSENTTLT